MAVSPFLLVGLGNPGVKYSTTRHNVGFMLLDYLAEKHGFHIGKNKMQGLYGTHRLMGKQVVFLQPQTYMNRSGGCVRQFVDYFDIPLAHLLVVHDDIDLDCGRIKVVARGGAGGHNGIRSIGQHMGTLDISRIKVGVGRPGDGKSNTRQPVDRYVLSDFTSQELSLIEERSAIVEEAVEVFLEQGIAACMNVINCKTSR